MQRKRTKRINGDESPILNSFRPFHWRPSFCLPIPFLSGGYWYTVRAIKPIVCSHKSGSCSSDKDGLLPLAYFDAFFFVSKCIWHENFRFVVSFICEINSWRIKIVGNLIKYFFFVTNTRVFNPKSPIFGWNWHVLRNRKHVILLGKFSGLNRLITHAKPAGNKITTSPELSIRNWIFFLSYNINLHTHHNSYPIWKERLSYAALSIIAARRFSFSAASMCLLVEKQKPRIRQPFTKVLYVCRTKTTSLFPTFHIVARVTCKMSI